MADKDRNLVNADVSVDEDLTDTGSYTNAGDSSSWEEFADYLRNGPIQPYMSDPMVGDTSPPSSSGCSVYGSLGEPPLPTKKIAPFCTNFSFYSDIWNNT